ncbi:MAG TPA: hypothetical protein VG734_17560 [Lacunisphaera sp.]|nr:hypothetical protein [Lacunisphaera sp.]
MKILKTLLTSTLVAGSLLVSTAARADLIGDTVNAAGYDVAPPSAVVGAGIEFNGMFGYMNFDFGANTLTVTTTTEVSWTGFGIFTFSGFDELITNVSIGSNSGFTGGIVSNFSFTGSTISLDLNSGYSGQGIRTLVFDINSTSVPEQGSIMGMLGTALVGAAMLRRRFAR